MVFSFLLAFAFVVFDLDSGRVIVDEGATSKRMSPCSTFKVPLSVMGYDTHILVDEKTPCWEYCPEYASRVSHVYEMWRQAHTPKLWLENSCVWFSQVLTEDMGAHAFSKYVDRFEYGNQDVSGGIFRSWLDSSLAISAHEQIDFLNKLIREELPVSEEAHRLTKSILYHGEIDGHRLYGKTGTGDEHGWFVGWVEGERNLSFALLDISGTEACAQLKGRAPWKK